MKLTTDFVVDKAQKRVVVTRSFAAPLARVWAAWTESALLDEWWAPKPWRTHTKTMDFRAGGHWLYSMVGPDGDAHFCRSDYDEVVPLERFSHRDAFCDEAGKPDTSMPRSTWTIAFNEVNGGTQVQCTIQHADLADLEKIIAMGFKEGFTAALENLVELLGH